MHVTSRDEDGYLEAGDLVSGGYGALEGDLGHSLRPLAGFGRDFEVIDPDEEEEEELWPGVVFTPDSNSVSTAPGVVMYESPNWNQRG